MPSHLLKFVAVPEDIQTSKPPVPLFLMFDRPHKVGLLAFLLQHLPCHSTSLDDTLLDKRNEIKTPTTMLGFDFNIVLL